MTTLHEGLFRTEKILFPEDFLVTNERGKEKRKQNEKEAEEERTQAGGRGLDSNLRSASGQTCRRNWLLSFSGPHALHPLGFGTSRVTLLEM